MNTETSFATETDHAHHSNAAKAADNDGTLRSLPADPDTLIAAADVPRYLGIAKQTMSRWRHEGRPPRFTRIGRRIFYWSGDLRELIRAGLRENTI